MTSSLRNGLVVAGCVLLGFVVSAGPGIVARAAEPERWRERLLAAPSTPEQLRIAELEQRLREREAERPGTASPSGAAPADRDALLAQNQELVRRNRALVLENQALIDVRARASGACTPPEGEDAKAQLRFWAERLRSGDYGLHGGLSSAQAAALGVLLRPTRPIDRDSPWQ